MLNCLYSILHKDGQSLEPECLHKEPCICFKCFWGWIYGGRFNVYLQIAEVTFLDFVFLHFPFLFCVFPFTFLFILHLLHSRIISICCSLSEREREREMPNSCTRFAMVSQKIISSSQGQLTDLWVGVVWRKEREVRLKEEIDRRTKQSRGEEDQRKKEGLRQGWLKKTAQKTNAKSKLQKCVQANWEGEPWQYLHSWPCFLLLLQLKRIEELPAMRWTGMRGNHMHANFHSFLVTQLFTESGFAIHTHIMWFYDVCRFAELKHSDGKAARAPR